MKLSKTKLILFCALIPGLSFSKDWSLPTALNQALKNNYDLEIANSEENMSLGFKKMEGRFLVSPPHISFMYATDDPYENKGEYDYSLNIGLELEIAGQMFLRKEIGSLEYEKAKTMNSWQKFLVTQQVKEKFYTLLYFQEKQKLLQTQVTTSRNLAFISQQQVQSGATSEFDNMLNKIDYVAMYSDLSMTKEDLAMTKEELANLLGINSNEIGSVKGSWSISKTFPSVETLYQHAINHRLDFKTAILNQKQKAKAYTLSKVSLIPNPEVGISFSKKKSIIHGDNFNGDPSITENLGMNEMTDKMLGFEISVPLTFLSGKKGEIMEAKAEKQKSQWEVKKMEQEIRNSISKFKDQWTIAQDNLKHLNTTGNISRNLLLLNEGYQKGNIDFTTYTTQKNRLIQAQMIILESRWFLTKTQIALETASQLDNEKFSATDVSKN